MTKKRRAKPYVPTEEEIAAHSLALQRKWSLRKQRTRAGLAPIGGVEMPQPSNRGRRLAPTIGRD